MRALGALRDDRREHLQVRLGLRAPPERGVRPDGRRPQKASVYWGRYYDPVRMDMTNFAGTTTGSIREEQVCINNQWVTYRIRGGPAMPDGFFSPSTKTPYTDELQIGYEVDLGSNMSFDAPTTTGGPATSSRTSIRALYGAQAYSRHDGTAISDRTRCSSAGTTSATRPNTRLRTSSSAPWRAASATYNGLELVFRKRFANHWQVLASYNYLTRRATRCRTATPTSRVTCSGSIRARRTCTGRSPAPSTTSSRAAARTRRSGASSSAAATAWNSGTIVSRTQLASSRRLPIQVAAADSYVFGGIVSAGSRRTPWARSRTRRGASSTCAPSTCAASARHRGVLRRHVQRLQRPGSDPQGRPGGGHGLHEVRRRHRLGEPAARVPRRPSALLVVTVVRERVNSPLPGPLPHVLRALRCSPFPSPRPASTGLMPSCIRIAHWCTVRVLALYTVA